MRTEYTADLNNAGQYKWKRIAVTAIEYNLLGKRAFYGRIRAIFLRVVFFLAKRYFRLRVYIHNPQIFYKIDDYKTVEPETPLLQGAFLEPNNRLEKATLFAWMETAMYFPAHSELQIDT